MAIFDVMSQSSQCLLGKSKACHRSASKYRLLQSFLTRNSIWWEKENWRGNGNGFFFKIKHYFFSWNQKLGLILCPFFQYLLIGKSKACHRSASEYRLQSFPTRNSGSIHPRQIRPSNSLRFNILSGGQSDGQEWIQRGCQSIWALSSSSKII